MSRARRAARKEQTTKTEEKETPIIEDKRTPFIPPIDGKLEIKDLINCLPLQLKTQYGEEIMKIESVEKAEKFIEEKLDEFFSDEKVSETFWIENPDDLPLDKDMEEYGKELDKMRLQDELDDLMTQIDRLCTDKLFTTISSLTASKIVKQYNEIKVDPSLESSTTSRKTDYVLTELHVMTISKKLSFGTNIDKNVKELTIFLDKYHETSVVEVEEH